MGHLLFASFLVYTPPCLGAAAADYCNSPVPGDGVTLRRQQQRAQPGQAKAPSDHARQGSGGPDPGVLRARDLVLDPLIGSGTSVVLAAKLWRRYLGMDTSAQYTEIAKQRLAREVNTEPQNEESRRQARRNAGKALEDARKKDALEGL